MAAVSVGLSYLVRQEKGGGAAGQLRHSGLPAPSPARGPFPTKNERPWWRRHSLGCPRPKRGGCARAQERGRVPRSSRER